MAKHRLFSLSIQDLILQSHALHYVADNRPSQGQLFLENRGYRTTMELLNQLDTRLTLAQATPPESHHTSLTGLRNELETLIENYRERGNDQTKKTQTLDIRASIDRWFTNLYNLNRTLKEASTEENNKYKQLLEQNNLLAFLIIGMTVLSTTLNWWPQSKIGKYIQHRFAQLQYKVQTNPLTKTLNRSGWIYQLTLKLRASNRLNPEVGSIAMLSIDYFKQYNDTFGTEAANQRLLNFAENLRANSRPDDLLAHIAEEEFAVFLPNCSAAETKRIIDRARHNGLDTIDFSAGITQISNQHNVPRLMAAADQALHQAQQNGGNQSILVQ